MLGFHVVLVILHRRITNSTELDIIDLMTLNTIFDVHFVTDPPKRDGSNTKNYTSKSQSP